VFILCSSVRIVSRKFVMTHFRTTFKGGSAHLWEASQAEWEFLLFPCCYIGTRSCCIWHNEYEYTYLLSFSHSRPGDISDSILAFRPRYIPLQLRPRPSWEKAMRHSHRAATTATTSPKNIEPALFTFPT